MGLGALLYASKAANSRESKPYPRNIFVIGSPYANLPEREGGPTDLAESAAITSFFHPEIDTIIADLSDPYASEGASPNLVKGATEIETRTESRDNLA